MSLIPLLLRRKHIRVASPATVTPTYGDELVTNGNMETGDPPTGWSPQYSAVLSSVADERTGGSGTKSINVAWGLGTNLSTSAALTVSSGNFVALAGWGKLIVGPTAQHRVMINDTPAIVTSFSADALWTNKSVVGLVNTNNPRVWGQVINVGEGDSARFDDVSVKPITTSSMFGDVSQAAPSGHFITAWPTTPALGNVVGMVLCLDSEVTPLNYIGVWTEGTNVVCGKWVNGVYTALASNASAWANDARLYARITVSGGTLTLKIFHKEAQVGSDISVADATIISNTKHGWFTTDGTKKPSYFEIY